MTVNLKPSSKPENLPSVPTKAMDGAWLEFVLNDASITPAALSNIYDEFKCSNSWDKEKDTFNNFPSTRLSKDKRSAAVVEFLNGIGDNLSAICEKHGYGTLNKKRQWTAPQNGKGPLVLTTMDGTILSELHIHPKAESPTKEMLYDGVVAATALMRTNPDRFRGIVLLLCDGILHVVAVDPYGAIWIDGYSFKQAWSQTQKLGPRNQRLLAFLSALMALHVGPTSSLGVDPTIQRGTDGDIDRIKVGDWNYGVLEVLGTPDDWVAQQAIVRRVVTLAPRGPKIQLYVKDSWVTKADMDMDMKIMKRLEGTEGVATLYDARIVPKTALMCLPGRPMGEEALVHHRQLMSHAGKPIERFGSKYELLSVFIDVVDAISDIHNSGRTVLHPDLTHRNLAIDVENVMQVQGKPVARGLLVPNVRAQGVAQVQPQGYTIISPNGVDAWTHASLNVLNAASRNTPYQRTLADDLQSIFIGLLTVCLSVSGAGHPHRYTCKPWEDTPLSDWNKSADAALANRTRVLMDPNIFKSEVLDAMSPYFDDLHGCLEQLRAAIMKEDAPIDKWDIVVDIVAKTLATMSLDEPEWRPDMETKVLAEAPKSFVVEGKGNRKCAAPKKRKVNEELTERANEDKQPAKKCKMTPKEPKAKRAGDDKKPPTRRVLPGRACAPRRG
ncbi:hypothetical protein BD626DRAFT_581789 [Schizophyllum amplum]|uniref:Fungal-type protein kinase domain-containing protein n=1 Tax=Schizophyllum amplum TaxID=97359 RepID=A0A550CQS9_9AGAR|nr:hypothetical protein BD626DRAFT_581789 [Auriculariopsis ampla]